MKSMFFFLLTVLPAMTCALPMMTCAASAEDTRLFEIRTYYANPGKLDALHSRFRDHTLALFEKHGMTNIGYWVPARNDDSRLIYVLAFPDADARDKAWQDFLNDEDWKAAYADSIKDGRLVGKIESVLLKATDYSPEIKSHAGDEARLFELRTYTTNEGKLDGLNSRFRDHTVKLFEKHGLTNVAYWTPADEKDGRDNKLVYIIAANDEDVRNAGFKSFGQDPEWQAARKASEENGRLLVENGVESVFLIPTDYSPTK